jgi:hypothetical protein
MSINTENLGTHMRVNHKHFEAPFLIKGLLWNDYAKHKRLGDDIEAKKGHKRSLQSNRY